MMMPPSSSSCATMPTKGEMMTRQPARGQAALRWGIAAILGLIPWGNLVAQDLLADSAAFREGCQAFVDERYAAASAAFELLWTQLPDTATDPAERNFVAIRLLDAWLANGEAIKALGWIQRNAAFQPEGATLLRYAAVWQSQRHFAEAADAYSALDSVSFPLTAGQKLDHAVCLAQLGEAGRGLKLVEAQLPSSSAEAGTMAALGLLAGSSEHALKMLDAFGPVASDDPARFPLNLLKIRAMAGTSPEAALDLALAELTPDRSRENLDRVFALVETILATGDGTTRSKTSATLASFLSDWEDHAGSLGTAARFAQVTMITPRDQLAEELALYMKNEEKSPYLPDARLQLALLKLGAGDTLAAANLILELPVELSPSARLLLDRFDFQRARMALETGPPDMAMTIFEQLANRVNGDFHHRCRQGAILAAIRADDWVAYDKHFASLASEVSGSDLPGELAFAAGVELAKRGDSRAFARLTDFIQTYPKHPAQIDARLTLAELHLNEAPARPSAAGNILEALRQLPLSPAQQERLDQDTIWTKLIAGDGGEAARLATEFLNRWPQSPAFVEVALLLGNQFLRTQQYPQAEAVYDRIVELFPDSASREVAMFFRAKAAPPTSASVSDWTEVIRDSPNFAPFAQHELGLLYLSLDQYAAAREAFESLIAMKSASTELRYAAQADLAFTDYAEALANGLQHEPLSEAARRFGVLAQSEDAPRLWRYNAAVRQGKCLEALGTAPLALEIYRSLIEDPELASTTLSIEESEWIFRAGFSAIRLLREQKDARSAVRLADHLSIREGTRAIEAAQLAEQLRLSNWIWE
jgi:TolA-binding protein